MFEDLWGGLSEAVSETWDVVYDASQEVLADTILSAKESGRDVDTLRASEPVKGQNSDGTPIVVDKQTTQAAQQPSIINGVSNTSLMVGGALVVGLLFVMRGD